MAGWPPARAATDEVEMRLRQERECAIEMVLAAMKDQSLFWRVKQVVKDEVIKPKSTAGVTADEIAEVLRSSGLSMEIKRSACESFRKLQQHRCQIDNLADPAFPLPPLPVSLDATTSLDALDWVRWRWGNLLLQRLRELSEEQRQPFLRPRRPPVTVPSSESVSARRGRLVGADENEVTTHSLVDLGSLYRLLTSELQKRSAKAGGPLLGQGLWWGSLGVRLHAENLDGIRCRFASLAPELEHLGVRAPSRQEARALLDRRVEEGQVLLGRGYIPELEAYARLGAPPSLRRDLWSACLSVPLEPGPGAAAALREVAQSIAESEWLTDDVLRLDVAEHCANDVCYFPFDEIVEAMNLTLSRDSTLQQDCDCSPPHVPIVAGAAPGIKMSLVPPAGVVPFEGISTYACPFAFLGERLEVVYPVYRAFYCRYLCRLSAISTQPGTLLPLCALFESLVFTGAPHVGFHLAQLGPEAAPLRIAFPWIVRAFAGFLRADQVLWLWDRVIGFGSLEPVAVLAAAIFAFRGRLLLSAQSAEEVQLVFADISSLEAIPLLQGFVFAEHLSAFSSTL